ncbi:MAG: hypothetical protein RLZZ630_135, partial [Bacteroidota bacterium]
GSLNGLVFIRVIHIGKGPGIPMRKEHDPVTQFGMKRGDNISSVQHFPIEGTDLKRLHNDGIGPFRQTVDEPVTTLLMGLRIRHSWTELHLLFQVGIS